MRYRYFLSGLTLDRHGRKQVACRDCHEWTGIGLPAAVSGGRVPGIGLRLQAQNSFESVPSHPLLSCGAEQIADAKITNT
jgi:hypothetical protein